MKKTLVAMAALAVVGAASAQSTVTLYGRVDLVVANVTQKLNGVATADNNVGLQMSAGNALGLTGSRWGLRGTEDLGGGLNAVFQLENGFDPSNGNFQQGGRQFGRIAQVGFTGSWGSIMLGRTGATPYTLVAGNVDAQGYGTLAPAGYAFNGPLNQIGGSSPAVGVHFDHGRASNSFTYATPNMGGFTGAFIWAPGENKNPVTGVGATDYTGFMAQYGNGPIYVGLGYERSTFKAVGVSQADSGWVLGGSYNFGPASLFAAYERGSSNVAGGVTPNATLNGSAAAGGAGDDKGYSIGVRIPMGALTLSTSYAQETTKATGAVLEGKNSAYGIQAQYDLSKRTQLYTHAMQGKSNNAAGTSRIKHSAFVVGVNHRF